MAHPSLPPPRGGEIRVRAPVSAPVGALASLPVGPVVLMPRRLPGGVLATLDALPPGALPRLDHEGPVAGLRRAMRAALAERLPRPRWLANWLLDDVLDQAALVAELTGAAALRAVLRVVREGDGDDMGQPAPAPSRFRLVTAYRGAGFEWLPPRAAAGREASLATDLAAWPTEGEASLVRPPRRLPRGDVAILRGEGDGEGLGVAHRAAPGTGTGTGTGLLLTVDAPAPPRRAAPLPAERRANC